MTLTEIAQQIKDVNKNIILIYAFNGTGKTRLSVEYKDLTKSQNSGNHSGIYYNAFSEELFNQDNETLEIKIKYCNLNQYHNYLTENIILDELAPFKPKYGFKFNSTEAEKGIESITFFIKGEEDNPIKISRGEERIF